GYGDGLPRAASLGAMLLIGGELAPVAGSIAMDQLVVDVGDRRVAVGDRVVAFGDPATGAPTIDSWADAAGTINYEVTTRLGRRDRKSTRLNSSHVKISYAVFCLKKKNKKKESS